MTNEIEGKPKKTWRRGLETEINKMGWTWMELQGIAPERKSWH